MRYVLITASAALAALCSPGETGVPVFGAGAAVAQQMGSQPWGFSPRSRSLAAQFQFQRDLSQPGSAASASDGIAALQQYVTQYHSSSTSIGNLNEVTQVLSGGSTGSVGQSTEQTSQGNQGSSATTEATVNSASVTVQNQSAAAQGDAEKDKSPDQPADQNPAAN